MQEPPFSKCSYCGQDSDCRDHVIPLVYFGGIRSRSFNSTRYWLTPACWVCNTLAGSAVFFTIPDKAKYIKQRFLIKYRKILRTPEWTEQELKQVSYKLRVQIFNSLVAKRVALEKIKGLEKVIELEDDYLMPDFIKTRYKKLEANHKKTIRKIKWKKNISQYTNTAKNTTLVDNQSIDGLEKVK